MTPSTLQSTLVGSIRSASSKLTWLRALGLVVLWGIRARIRSSLHGCGHVAMSDTDLSIRGLMVSSLPSLMVLPSWCLLIGLRTASGKKAPASPAQNAPSF